MVSDRADTTVCASVWEAPSCASEKHSSADIAVEKPGSSYQRLEGTNYTIEVHAPRAARTAPRAPRTSTPRRARCRLTCTTPLDRCHSTATHHTHHACDLLRECFAPEHAAATYISASSPCEYVTRAPTGCRHDFKASSTFAIAEPAASESVAARAHCRRHDYCLGCGCRVHQAPRVQLRLIRHVLDRLPRHRSLVV